MACGTLARDRDEPLGGPYSLRPERVDADRDLCADSRRRLEGLLRHRNAFHEAEAASVPSSVSGTLLTAALDRMANEAAYMSSTMPSIIMLAKAEVANGYSVTSAEVTAVLEAPGSSLTSILAFLDAFISATDRGTVMVEAPAETMHFKGASTPAGEARTKV
jgi:hypothetical protein